MKTLATIAAKPPLVLPRQANANGTSVLYALKPRGLNTAFVESLTSYLRRLGYEHARRPSILVSELIRKPHAAGAGEQLFAALSLSESLNGNVETTPVFLAYLESLTWVPEVRRTAFGDRVPGLYLARSGCVVRQWCPACIAEDGAAPYDRLLWSLKAYEVCVVHERALTGVCDSCKLSHLPFKKNARPDRCPCGRLLSATATAKRPVSERERALVDLVMRVDRGERVTIDQVFGGVQAFVQRTGSLSKATALMRRQHATLGNVLRNESAIQLESLLRALEAGDETLDEFLGHPRKTWVTVVPTPSATRTYRRRASALHLAPKIRAELKRPDAKVRTLGRFADDYGVSYKALHDQLPELTAKLVARGVAIRHRRRQQREAAEIAAACDAVRAYFKAHGTVTIYGASKLMAKPALMQTGRVHAAVVQLRDELMGTRRHSTHPGNTKTRATTTTHTSGTTTNTKTRVTPRGGRRP